MADFVLTWIVLGVLWHAIYVILDPWTQEFWSNAYRESGVLHVTIAAVILILLWPTDVFYKAWQIFGGGRG